MRPEDAERERTCFDLLRAVQDMEVLLVGGYAVSAYGPPRFSVDLGLVLEGKIAPTIRTALRTAGFLKEKDWDGGGVFAGRAERWVIGKESLPSSVDLLVDAIVDRVSGATFTFQALRETATRRPVRGVSASSFAEPLVPSKEALIALKLHVGRRIDFRDVVVLAGQELDREAMSLLIAQPYRKLVLGNVVRLLSALETVEFKDSLKGVYMLDDRIYLRYIEGARDLGQWLAQKLRPE